MQTFCKKTRIIGKIFGNITKKNYFCKEFLKTIRVIIDYKFQHIN